jgi:alkylation response protein AidB-like acyl-CoA dehydrogenase
VASAVSSTGVAIGSHDFGPAPQDFRAQDFRTLIERAHAMIPILREREPAAERTRCLAPETIAGLKRAGMFRVLQPTRYGGMGGNIADFIAVAHEVARGSGCAAWIYGNVALHSWIIGMFPKEAQDDIWADEDTITSSCLRPTGVTATVSGGYRIKGRWPYVSGCDHTDWTVLGLLLQGSDGKKQPAYALVPRRDYSIVDEWQVSGLAGTGSKDLVIEDAFVPEHRVLTMAQVNSKSPPGLALHDHPIYRIPLFSSFSFFIATPVVGMARGAVDQYIEYVKTRQTAGGAAGGGEVMAGLAAVQMRVGEAEMRLDAALAMLLQAANETAAAATSDAGVELPQRIRNRRAQSFAARLASEAIDELYDATGATGIFLHDPVQRIWRDVHAGTKHFSLNWDAMRTMCGQFSLGLQPSLGMY